MLDTDLIQNVFGSVLSDIYGDGVIKVYTMQRKGSEREKVFSHYVPCKVQQDECTDSQKQQTGYTAKSVRLLVLRQGHDFDLSADWEIETKSSGKVFSIAAISTDPARSYWDIIAENVVRNTNPYPFGE